MAELAPFLTTDLEAGMATECQRQLSTWPTRISLSSTAGESPGVKNLDLP